MCDELIARLEAATEGGRELDFMTMQAVGLMPVEAQYAACHHDYDYGLCWQDKHNEYFQILHCTTSIDAALQLVPDGWWWDMHHSGGVLRTGKEIYHARLNDGAKMHWGMGCAAAIALCVASLKARQS